MSEPSAPDQPAIDRSRRLVVPLACASLFLAVAGVRLWMVSRFGSDLPVADQWDAEGAQIFQRHFSGTLTVGDWFAPHNEHRIPLTRLLSFALMSADGQWDARVQMVLNAFIQAAVAAGLLLAVLRGAGKLAIVFWTALMIALFTLPYGWENTLSGFQSQFYLLVGFSLIALHQLPTARAPSRAWIGGVLASVAALLAMGSGTLAPLAVLGVVALVLVRERREWRRALGAMGPTIVTCALLALLGAALTRRVDWHDQFRARSVQQFIGGVELCLAWPWMRQPAWAIVAWLPIAVFTIAYLRGAVPDGRRQRFTLALAIWSLLQAAALAYSRAGILGSSRYGDVLCFGLVANALAMASWVGWGSWRARAATAAFAVWLAANGAKLVSASFTGGATDRAGQYAVHRGKVAAFVETGEDRYLVPNESKAELPYPDRERLAALLRDPVIRRILPGSVQERPALTGITGVPEKGVISRWQPGWAPDFWERSWKFGTARPDDRRFEFEVAKRVGRPFLIFYVRGNARAVSVVDGDGRRASPWVLAPHDEGAWSPLVASCPTRVCVVSGDADPEGTTLTEPREIGTLAAWAFVLAWNAGYVIAAGLVLAAVAIALLVAPRRLPARVAAPTASGAAPPREPA